MLGWLWSQQQIARTLRTMWPDNLNCMSRTRPSMPQSDFLLTTSILRTSPSTRSVDAIVAVAEAAPATGAAVLLAV
jgi:hypothetical protein